MVHGSVLVQISNTNKQHCFIDQLSNITTGIFIYTPIIVHFIADLI
jgi:hypothetical protein